MRPRQIHDHPIRILRIREQRRQVVARREEQLALHDIRHHIVSRPQNPTNRNEVRHPPHEQHRRDQHPADNPDSQIRRRPHTVPVERSDRDHDHHGHERRHRNHPDEVAEHDHQQEQEDPGAERRDAGPRARRLHVDHRLTDHGAPAHAAEHAGQHVRDALPPRLAGLVRVGVGDLVDELRGEQRLHEPDERDAEREGRDDRERLPRQRNVRDEQRRQAPRQLALIADRRHRDPEGEHDARHDDDRHERRRHDLGELRHHEHHDDAERHQRIHQPRHVDELRELRAEHEDRERVHEPDHDAAGDEPHQLRDAEHPEDHLEDPGEDDRRDEVVEAVRRRDRSDHERHGTGRRGHHRGSPAEERDRHRHDERREQADLRVDARDHRECDRLRDEREPDDEPGQHLPRQQSRVLQRIEHRGVGAIAGAVVDRRCRH
ncbi:unnamed protein product [Penicillium discolor]